MVTLAGSVYRKIYKFSLLSFQEQYEKSKGVIIEQHTKMLYFKIHPQGGLFVGKDILVITQNTRERS